MAPSSPSGWWCSGTMATGVSNHDSWPILIVALTAGDREEPVNAVVDSGETIMLHPETQSLGDARLHIQMVRELDMILPRNRCVIRHRAESVTTEKLSDLIMDIVFDVGQVFSADSVREFARNSPPRKVAARPHERVGRR